MSQVMRYRQYWMATLKDRHCCQICGELAVSAFWVMQENDQIEKIYWLCDDHISWTTLVKRN